MYKFLERYMPNTSSSGNQNDGEQIEQFIKRITKLHYTSLSYIYNNSMMMSSLVYEIYQNKAHGINEDNCQVDMQLDKIILPDEDNETLSSLVRSVLLGMLGSLDFENMNLPDMSYKYDFGFCGDNIEYYLNEIANKFSSEPQRSLMVRQFEIKSRLFSPFYRNDNVVDVINEIVHNTNLPLRQMMSKLKEVFLSLDDVSLDFMLAMRKAITSSPLGKKVFSDENSTGYFDNLVDLFCNDAMAVRLFVGDESARVLTKEEIENCDIEYFSIYILLLIYVRKLIAIVVQLLPNIEDENVYEKGVGVYFIKSYLHLGLIIHYHIYEAFSVQDTLAYLLGEINFNITNKFTYQDPIFHTENFEQFINTSRAKGSRYKYIDSFIDAIKEDAELLLKKKPNTFHDVLVGHYTGDAPPISQKTVGTRVEKNFGEDIVVSYGTRNYSFDDVRKMPVFKSRLRDAMRELIKKVGLGKIRGEAKKK